MTSTPGGRRAAPHRLLTSSLDSPQLQAWAVEALIPQDAEGLGDFMAGLHVVSQMLLH
jgi:hypothetical protein